jgi:YVTN family beta-propeller protein
MAYVTYHLIGPQFHYYVAAVSLPSAQIRWTVEIPNAQPIDAMAVAPGGATVYTVVGSENAPELLPIDSSSGRLGVPLALPGSAPLPQGFAISPDGRYALAAHPGDLGYPLQVDNGLGDEVTVIDLAQRSIKATIAVGEGPSGVAVSPDSRTAFVTTIGGLRVIDLAHDSVTATVPLSQDGALVVTHSGLALAISQGEDLVTPPSTISLVNPRTLQPQTPITLPYPAGAPVVSCDGDTAYAITQGQPAGSNDAVEVLDRIDIATRQVVPVLQFPFTGGAEPVIAESPTQDMIWVAQATQACGVSSCPTKFMAVGTDATSSPSSVATLPTEIEQLAIGPQSS